MSSALEVIRAIEANGGRITVEGDRLVIVPRQAGIPLLPQLRERKPEVIAILRARGGRVAAFPHCPNCCSFALYRKDNIGAYECLTCGLLNISEDVARRLQ